eukprot:956387-Pleurochrysis_carterae.AAC.1
MAVVNQFISIFTASATGSVGLVDSARDVVESPSSSSSLMSSGGGRSRRNVRFEYSESGDQNAQARRDARVGATPKGGWDVSRVKRTWVNEHPTFQPPGWVLPVVERS